MTSSPSSGPRPLKSLRGLDLASVFLASAFFLSCLPELVYSRFLSGDQNKNLSDRKWTGAGFIGSIWGALTYLFLPKGEAESLPLILVGVAIAVLVAHRAEKALASHDDSRIVIDEWIGVWIALWGVRQQMTVLFIVAFALFRCFDVLKGPWGRALQKLPGGWGVTLDDVLAGILANMGWRVLSFFK